MSNPTAINAVYWAALALVVIFSATIVVIVFASVATHLIGVRRRRLMLETRYRLRLAGRHARAFEDACWFLLRNYEMHAARRLMAERHARHLDELVAELKAIVARKAVPEAVADSEPLRLVDEPLPATRLVVI